MRLKIGSLLAALVAILTAVQWTAAAVPALATPCSLNLTSDLVSENWTNGGTFSNVDGVRDGGNYD
jgi:hypothetical protein